MKILITGGKGYIARNIAPILQKKRHDVYSPSHQELDILDFDQLQQFIQQNNIEAVIHTASKGGRRIKKDTFEDTFIPNIKMFENLCAIDDISPMPMIFLGSGAELDRRIEKHQSLDESWPIDPYGLSKNIIARRISNFREHFYNLRIFGIFNHDEEPQRFIKRSILQIKSGKPIEIYRNKMMDFLFLDDLAELIDYILIKPEQFKKLFPYYRTVDMVYGEKLSLLDISQIIHKHLGEKELSIIIKQHGMDFPYVGDGFSFTRFQNEISIVGIEEGIKRTIQLL